MGKASEPLFEQLGKTLKADGEQLAQKIKGLVLFKVDDDEWTLDLRSGAGSLTKGSPPNGEKPDLTLTMAENTFVQLVNGKTGPQTAFLMRKLKISGSMGMAMKLQPILDAAAPKAKL
ncbi:hypothetical protein WJX72_009727 [[Myrmecia] bisecta]|uniref:SCP2 domain-containing protein n=1 Tax=[Myrmecia] bisecta TaxID=41462 RepID=A0AAW1QS83_9CHLO